MDGHNDEQANEDAARRIQAEMWAADQAAAAAAEDNAGGGNGNENNGGGDENANGGDAAGAAAAEDNADIEEEDRERARGAVDGGIAGEARDENGIRITRSLLCPIVSFFDGSLLAGLFNDRFINPHLFPIFRRERHRCSTSSAPRT